MAHISIRKNQTTNKIGEILIEEPLSKKILRISNLAKILIVIVLGGAGYFLVRIVDLYEDSNYFPVIIILIITVFFLLWISSLYLFFNITSTRLESKIIAKLFSLLLIMGILSAYFAVVIENKSFVLVGVISGFFASIGQFPQVYYVIHYIFYVFIIPIVEEIAKIFPIIILLGNFARINLEKNKSIHSRIVPSFRLFILLGGFFGAWFDLFEQFLSYSSSTESTVIDFLVFRRSIYPLHAVTTMLVAAGFGITFLYRNTLSKKIRISIGILFLILSISFHSLWNFNTTFNTNQETRLMIFSVLGIISYILFIIFLFVLLLFVPSYCSNCLTQHIGDNCSLKPNPNEISKEELEKMKDTEALYDEKTHLLVCSQCRTPVYNGEFCLNCWSFPKIQCRNCNQVLPSYSRICWSCGTKTDALYEKMSSSSPPFLSSIAVGFTRIIAVGMLISFIFTFVTIEDTLSFLGYTLFLLSIIIAIIITVVWHRYKKTRVKAILSSMNLVAIIAISILVTSLYMIAFSILMIISIFQMVYGIIGLFCTLLISAGSVFFLIRTTRGVRLIII